MEHERLRVVQPLLAGFVDTTYRSEPPRDAGTFHEIFARRLRATTRTRLGAPGTDAGVIEASGNGTAVAGLEDAVAAGVGDGMAEGLTTGGLTTVGRTDSTSGDGVVKFSSQLVGAASRYLPQDCGAPAS